MANNQRTQEFYGGVIQRIFVIRHKDCVDSCSNTIMEFIKQNFNNLRNYREFTYPPQIVNVIELRSNSTINTENFKPGDAILLMGMGRLIDKASYELANKCFALGVPVYFIKSTCSCCNFGNTKTQEDSRAIIIKTKDSTKFYYAPDKYFMEISDADNLTLCKTSDSLYAILPGMVPILN